MILTNKYQTELTDEFLSSLKEETREGLVDAISNIEFIKRLISPDRQYAKDRPRDDKGRIIVDLCNPHILEDMDYFRESAIHFEQHGCYTKLRPNGNPNSEYGKWIRRELDRIWHGMVRPSDGEWITGDMYFYLNYVPIRKSEVIEGTKIADRVVGFPSVLEGIYLWFHYVDQARHGGIYNDFKGGNHCVWIAKRGAGKSYACAAMLARLFVTGDNERTCKDVVGVITAYLRDTLTKDGTLNKFEVAIDHCSQHTQFPRKRLNSSINDMIWKMGYIDSVTGTKMGSQNEVIGVTSKDNVDKARGKRASKFIYEEFGAFPKFIDTWTVNKRSVQDGDYIFGTAIAIGTGGSEGSNFYGALQMLYSPRGYNVYALKNVYDKGAQGKAESVFFYGAYLNRLNCYNKDGVSDVVKALVEILEERYTVKYNTEDPMQIVRTIAEDPITIQEAIMKREATIYPVSDLNDRKNEIDQNPRALDDIWVGKLQITNGIVSYAPDPGVKAIRNFPLNDNKAIGAIEIHKMPEKDRNGKVYPGRYIAGCLLPGEKVLTDSGLKNVEEVTFDDRLVNIEGEYVDINTLLTYDKVEEEVFELKIANTFRTTTFTKEHPIYVSNRITKYSTKRERQRQYTFNFNFKTVDRVSIGQWVRVPNLYKKEIMDYSLPFNRAYLESEDFWWFIGLWLGDGWNDKNKLCISFNEKEQKHINRFIRISKELFNRSPYLRKRGHCIEGSICYTELKDQIKSVFGQYAHGKTIPESIKYLPHSLKSELILGYLDSDGCITNKLETEFVSINLKLLEGIQDMLFSLGCVSSLRKLRGATASQRETYSLRMSKWETYKFRKLFQGIDDEKLIKVIPVECRCRPTFYECEVDDKYIYFKITDITKSTYTGKVYNFDCETHTFMCHHIPTHNCDPYDDDVSNTKSLGSIYVLDLWTDQVVCEYTGRPMFAEDFYENCRRILLFYNATCNYENNKKGLYTYFSKTNCSYLLSDTLDFLKDKDMIKGVLYGNKAKGTVATAPIKSYARRCIRDWLLKPIEKADNIDGQEVVTTIPQLTTLKSRALIEELVQWTPEGNFDRHDALGMLMLLREDRLRLLGEKPRDSVGRKDDRNYLGNDDFFTKNYRPPREQ